MTRDPQPTPGADPGPPERALLSEGAAYTLVDVAQQGLAMVSLPVFFFFLTVADFGVITSALVLAQIAMTLSTLGLDFTVMRFYFRWSEGERRSITAAVTAASTAWSLLLIVVAHVAIQAFAPSRAAYWPLSLGWWAGLLLGLRGVPLSIVRVTGAMRPYATFVLGGAILQVIIQIACVALGMGPSGYMLGYAAGAAVSVLLALVFVRRDYAWSPGGWRLPADTIGFTLRVLPSVLFSRLIAVADRLVVGRWGGLDALGLYGAASRFTTPIKLLSGGFKMALVPLLSRQEAAGAKADALQRMNQFIVLTMLLLGSLVMLGVWFIRYTPWAADANALQQLVGLLLIGQFLSGLTFLGQAHLYYSTRPEGASLVVGLNAAALIVGLLILVPRASATGAAVAAILAGAVGFMTVASIEFFTAGRLAMSGSQLLLIASFIPSAAAAWSGSATVQLPVFVITLTSYIVAILAVTRRFGRPSLQELYGR